MTTELKQKIIDKLQLALNTNPTILYDAFLHQSNRTFQRYIKQLNNDTKNKTIRYINNNKEIIYNSYNEYFLNTKLNNDTTLNTIINNCDINICNKSIEEQEEYITNYINSYICKDNSFIFDNNYKTVKNDKLFMFIYLLHKDFQDFKIELANKLKPNVYKEIVRIVLTALLLYFFNYLSNKK